MGKQKRSANTYQKINGVFYRDENNIIMPYDELCQPELNYLRNVKMEASIKVDGTNIRLEVTKEWVETIQSFEFYVSYKGKTDNANIPKELEEFLKTHFPEDKVLAALGLKKFISINEFAEHKWINNNGEPDFDKVPSMWTIYGEGYGRKIQSVGSRYIKNGVNFIVFDVKVDNTYLLTENAKDRCCQL